LALDKPQIIRIFDKEPIAIISINIAFNIMPQNNNKIILQEITLSSLITIKMRQIIKIKKNTKKMMNRTIIKMN